MKRRKLVLGILIATLTIDAATFAALKDTHKQTNPVETA